MEKVNDETKAMFIPNLGEANQIGPVKKSPVPNVIAQILIEAHPARLGA